MPPETTAETALAGPPSPPEESLPAVAEALLFVSDGPLDAATLAHTLGISVRRLERVLDDLAHTLGGRGVRLQRGPEGLQLITAPEAAAHVEYLLGLEGHRRLTTASLETLAIIAYRQPVTRSAIEAIRGVNCDAAIATLRARGLVDEGGRAPGPGRPTLFVTTQRFLEHFGLERPEDLPGLDELAPPEPVVQRPLPGLATGGAEAAPVASAPPATVAAAMPGLAEFERPARRPAPGPLPVRALALPQRPRAPLGGPTRPPAMRPPGPRP
ncbi:MAG: SMC-Scp complex subunit ScpB [Dehalococcoidia bacterium]|nr:SMC-Scp complex subunit ScpB [Dehalococcoidia bacterium]